MVMTRDFYSRHVIGDLRAGNTADKVCDTMQNEIEKFEEGFPEGVYVDPKNNEKPRIRVRALFKYCNERGITPEDLSEEEKKQFIVTK
ncbi:hypothetical protein MOF23_07860 [Bacillus inaquosorum]|uniref:hypothetical protein n=1 Tax=Bacillus inaquosorum TaxID=483913 RepID=UPI00228290AA|nr:hypothetical protein [Bacillus inaquosorum]MCY9308885.1 hypothetical protein [Bacillus inaquosorum]